MLELRYRLDQLKYETYEGKHFVKVLLSSDSPQCIDFTCEPGDSMQLTVWCLPHHADKWDDFIDQYDIAHNEMRFRYFEPPNR